MLMYEDALKFILRIVCSHDKKGHTGNTNIAQIFTSFELLLNRNSDLYSSMCIANQNSFKYI